MPTTVSVVSTVAIVALGRWSNDQKIDMKFVVGSGVYAVAISMITAGNQKFGEQLALLVLVSAFFLYIRSIASGLGFTKRADEKAPRSLF